MKTWILFVGHTYLFMGHTYLFMGHTYLFMGHTYLFMGHTYLFMGHTYLFMGNTNLFKIYALNLEVYTYMYCAIRNTKITPEMQARTERKTTKLHQTISSFLNSEFTKKKTVI